MNTTRRHLLALPLALSLPSLHAQDTFPSRPIKVIVAFAAGTGSDAIARIAANAMQPILGQPVVVDNRAGAGGAVGTEQAARSPADGYTLALATTSTLLTNPALSTKPRYHAEKDFTPVSGLGRTAFVIVVANTPEAPQTLQQLLARLKEREGSFGSPGLGTVSHLTAELLLKRANAKALHAPYRGSSQAFADIVGGQLLFGCDTLVSALPLIRGGKLRALAVSSGERLPALPAVPTVAESGVPDFKVIAWWGLVAPAGTPPEVVRKLADAAARALAAPEVKTQLAGMELEPMPLSPAAFGQLIRTELPVWTEFVRSTGFQVE